MNSCTAQINDVCPEVFIAGNCSAYAEKAHMQKTPWFVSSCVFDIPTFKFRIIDKHRNRNRIQIQSNIYCLAGCPMRGEKEHLNKLNITHHINESVYNFSLSYTLARTPITRGAYKKQEDQLEQIRCNESKLNVWYIFKMEWEKKKQHSAARSTRVYSQFCRTITSY